MLFPPVAQQTHDLIAQLPTFAAGWEKWLDGVISSFPAVRDVMGPVMLTRYNMYPAAIVNANVAPGFSSGQAIAQLQEATESALPRNMRGYRTIPRGRQPRAKRSQPD